MIKDCKKLVLFTLATCSSDPNENRLPPTTRGTYSGPSVRYAQLHWRLSQYRESSVRGAISSLRRDGAVATLQRSGKAYIRLTTVGRELLLDQLPIVPFRASRWDGFWRIAMISGALLDHEVQATYRVLRRRLLGYGFGQVDRGVYLSPYGLTDQQRQQLLEDGAMGLLVLLEAKRFLFGDEMEWARQAWNLGNLSKEYAKLSAQADRAITFIKRENGLKEARKRYFRSLTSELFQVFEADPGLPEELTPNEYQAKSAWERYTELCAIIARFER